MKNYINLVTVLTAFMVLIGCENPDATIDGDEIELSNVALDDQTKKISYLIMDPVSLRCRLSSVKKHSSWGLRML